MSPLWCRLGRPDAAPASPMIDLPSRALPSTRATTGLRSYADSRAACSHSWRPAMAMRIRRFGKRLLTRVRIRSAAPSLAETGVRGPARLAHASRVMILHVVDLSTEYLENWRAVVPTAAAWVWREWGYRSPADCASDLNRSRRGAIPSRFVALRGSNPVGVVNLVACRTDSARFGPRCSVRYQPWYMRDAPRPSPRNRHPPSRGGPHVVHPVATTPDLVGWRCEDAGAGSCTREVSTQQMDPCTTRSR